MKTEVELDDEQARLTQRLLAIPGVELVASTEPVAIGPKKDVPSIPSRDLLFSRVWLGFGLDDDRAEAVRVFEKKFGHKPAFVYRDGGGRMLWVGPV